MSKFKTEFKKTLQILLEFNRFYKDFANHLKFKDFKTTNIEKSSKSSWIIKYFEDINRMYGYPLFYLNKNRIFLITIIIFLKPKAIKSFQ